MRVKITGRGVRIGKKGNIDQGIGVEVSQVSQCESFLPSASTGKNVEQKLRMLNDRDHKSNIHINFNNYSIITQLL